MIEINLLSEKSDGLTERPAFDLKKMVYLVPLFFAVLIFLHIYLGIKLVTRNLQLNALNSKWQALGAQIKELDTLKKEGAVFTQDYVKGQLTLGKIYWAKKLNQLSLDLPGGVWFNEMIVSGKDFNLKGSAVSLQKEEVSLIDKFMDNLKADADFFASFSKLELSSVERKELGGYDVVDFAISGALK